jgi:exopolyphosphatase/guanosine-5'-triphosphate,3'-diphosphate pyrophosphatase
MQRLASIDVGSNTIRLLIAEPAVSAPPRPYCLERRITRLGENFMQHRMLQPPAMERSIAALQEFVELMERSGVSHHSAGATAVVREAKNAQYFLDLIRSQTGLNVRVLNGSEEANLSLLGVASVVSDKKAPLAVFDIGGGSTELIRRPGGEIDSVQSSSLPLGVVHLTERFLQADPPGYESCVQLRRYISGVLKKLAASGDSSDAIWVGTAGTVTTLASMWLELEEYEPSKINGTVLQREWLFDLCYRLAAMEIAQRKHLPGLEPGREDIILAGGLVTLEIMDTFGFAEFTVSDAGLLEGLFLELCQTLSS